MTPDTTTEKDGNRQAKSLADYENPQHPTGCDHPDVITNPHGNVQACKVCGEIV